MGAGIYMLTGKMYGKLPEKRTVEVSRKYAAEGMVLLKNNNVLPLVEKSVALFGAGAIDTFVCGTGSGYVFSPYKINVLQGLENKGIEITSNLWLKNYKKYKKICEKKSPKIPLLSRRFSGITFVCQDDRISEEEVKDASSANTAIYVIHRNAGEGGDRKAIRGDYYLSENELYNIKLLAKSFEKFIVILNTCVIDASEIESVEGVDGIVLMGQAGLEAGNALADLLVGDVNFSGKLIDTWAKSYDDYPTSKTYSANDNDTLHEVYNEGIYVGYRYFDSFKKDVVYPFGYGLSYTSFELTNVNGTYKNDTVSVSLKVTNTGNCSGKEVVQVYVSQPNGNIKKAYQELKGYYKTNTLDSNCCEEVTIDIPLKDLASYDEAKASYVLEKGDYIFRVGNSSRNNKAYFKVNIDETIEVVKVSNQLQCVEELNELVAGPYEFEKEELLTIEVKASTIKTIDKSSKISREVITYVTDDSYKGIKNNDYFPINLTEKIVKIDNKPDSTLLDVKEGRCTMEEFVASLDYQVLLRLVTGTSCETKYSVKNRNNKKIKKVSIPMSATGKLTGLFQESLLIPPVSYCDGPAGLHMMGLCTTTFPTGMALSQTWNLKAAYEIGDCFGIEMETYNLDIILGPGMNIHRDPLCGRNFEYYSEDPFVTGTIAAEFVNGLQLNHKDRGVSPKHFFVNNQENDRQYSNSVASERTLREIYLKGFEIMVEKSHPKTIMSSYNLVNGVHTSSRYDLLTDVLRGEFGFDGYVMTDWDGTSNRVFDLYAGNDIIMGGYQTDLLACAITGDGPEFDKDGNVKTLITNAYGGFFKKETTYWNSFMPSKDGKDEVSTRVESGVALNEKVNKAVSEGYASIKENSDGSKIVTYKGTNMGAYLPLGVLQRNAARILTYTMNSDKMSKLIKGLNK